MIKRFTYSLFCSLTIFILLSGLMYSFFNSTKFQDTYSKKSELKIQLKEKFIQFVTTEEAEEEEEDISFDSLPFFRYSTIYNLEYSNLLSTNKISTISEKYTESLDKVKSLPIWISIRQLIL